MTPTQWFALLLIGLPAGASAQSMNAETFYSRAVKLSGKGALAIFSGGEIKALMSEGQAAGLRARDTRRATLAAGGKPRFCPPGKAVTMGSDEFLKRLAAIPRAERARIDMTEATTRVMTAKFPCPS